MKKLTPYFLLASLLLMLMTTFTSCEKFALDETGADGTRYADANVTVRVQQVQNMTVESQTRASSVKKLKEICTRLSFVVFDGEDKLAYKNQTSDDSDFGICHFNLDEGEYRLVVIAHSGAGNCSMSAPEKVKFANNKLTDTFSYYGRLSVTEDGAEAEVNLTRAVAALQLHISDETLPENVNSIKFYYTGGSSTLDATTGEGCVNSRQTETFKLSGDKRDFTVYTFPHDAINKVSVKYTISLLDNDAKTIQTYELADVPMKRNTITKATLSLKDGKIETGDTPGKDDNKIGFWVNDEWETDTIVYF